MLKKIYNLDSNNSELRKKYFNRFSKFPLRFKAQIYQRYLGAPYLQVEQYVPKSGLIVDLGCGLGNFCHVLALTSKRREILGIDFDKNRIKLAGKTIQKNDNISFAYGDLKSLKFKSAVSYILLDVLHHIDYKYHKVILTNIYNSLKSTGVLIMLESKEKPLWKYVIWRIWEFVAIGFNITKGESLSFRKEENLTELLNKIGYKVVKIPFDRGRFFPHILYQAKKI